MYKYFFKRIIDFILALIAMPFVLLIIIIFAPIICFSDKGNPFYNANRMGKNGKVFKMFKLRSMKLNAPDIRNADGSTFNSNNDSRVTKIGYFMRKTSIDELPQLINVLIGDMSFVGPRPTLAETPYEKYDEVMKKRITVKPGITGYSQAYFRNSISQDDKFKYDCQYVDKVSFLYDIKILFYTFYSVARNKNVFVENK